MNAKKAKTDTDNTQTEAIETAAPIAEDNPAPAPTPLEEAIAVAPTEPVVPIAEAPAEPVADVPVEDNSGHIDTTNPEEAIPVEPVVPTEAPNTGLGEIVTSGGATPEFDATPIGITQQIVPAVEDLADVSRNAISTEALSKLDETDSSRAAAIRSQANWVDDAAKIFKGPDRDQVELEENLRQMDEIDANNRAAQAAENAAKAKIEELASREQKILDLNQEFDTLKQRAMNIKAEIARLEALDAPVVEEVQEAA